MEPNITDNGIDVTFRDYIRVLFRHKSVILTCIITVMVTVFIGLKLKTPVFESSVKMLISAEKQVESPYYRQLYDYQRTQISLTQSEIVKSNPVIERAVMALELHKRPLDYEKEYSSPLKHALIDWQVKETEEKLSAMTPQQQNAIRFRLAVEGLKKAISVEPVRDTHLFTITVKDYNRMAATVIANVVSRSYVIFDLQQQLAELKLKYGEKHTTVTQLKDSIDKMANNLSGAPLEDIEAMGPASVKIIEQASIPLRPTGPSKLLMLLLALVMSIFLSVMLAFVFEYMDQTFKSPRDIEQFLKLPFLGSIPRKKMLEKALVKGKRKTTYSKFYQNLADQVYLLVKDKKLTALQITSALPKEGASTVIANLGAYLADKLNHKVLIIDANLRAPAMHKIFGLKEQNGLSELLQNKIDFNEAVQNPSPHLSVITAGQTELNPITLLDSTMMRAELEQAKKKYEVILIDCANLRQFKDGYALADFTDGIMLVVNEGKTRRQVAQAALAAMEGKPAQLLGVILNGRTFPIPGFVYDNV